MSKGSTRRPTDEATYQSNYDAIFGRKTKETTGKNGEPCPYCIEGILYDTDNSLYVICNSCHRVEDRYETK